MTIISPSRRAGSIALADVLLLVLQAIGLTERRRQDMASALRKVGKLLDRDLSVIPAEPRALAQRLANIPYEAHGLSKGRWHNIRSLVNAALAMAQPMMPGRHQTPLSPAWQQLYDQLAGHSSRARLSRLLHWLTECDIEPETVTTVDIQAYLAALHETSLTKDPEYTWRETAWAWNAAIRNTHDWPQCEVTIPSRREPYTLRWTAFPSTFGADTEGYLTRLGGDDLLGNGPARPAKASTIETRRFQILSIASALVRRGKDPSTILSLKDLVEVDAVKDALRFFLEKNGGNATSQTSALAGLLKAIAKHWVKVSDDHLNELADIVRRMTPKAQGMTRKNRDRLRQFDDLEAGLALIHLPSRLMKKADKLGPESKKAALLAQQAVAIELLLMAPVRISNLLSIDLDVHLIRHRRGGELHLVLEPDQDVIKNDEPLDFPLPDETAKLIDHYVTIYRPLLVKDPANRALFPGMRVKVKTRGLLGSQLTNVVHQHTGLKIHPHLFRHIAGKTYLDENPGGYGVVQRVLAHRSANTTLGFYAGAETAAAVRHFDKLILSLRHGART